MLIGLIFLAFLSALIATIIETCAIYIYQSQEIPRSLHHSTISSYGCAWRHCASFLIFHLTQVFTWLWLFPSSHGLLPFLSWSWWSCPTQGNEWRHDSCGLGDLGASQFQMFKENHASLPDSVYHYWLFHGLHLFVRWLCRDLLCNRKWLFNPISRFTRARKGISENCSVCSSLSLAYPSWRLLLYLSWVVESKHENLFILVGIAAIILVLWGIGDLRR